MRSSLKQQARLGDLKIVKRWRFAKQHENIDVPLKRAGGSHESRPPIFLGASMG